MQSLRLILRKIYPKLRAIEENPKVIIRKLKTVRTNNPFEPDIGDVYEDVEVTCIYSENPETIIENNQLTSSKDLYLYILKDQIDNISHDDIVIFNNNQYKIEQLQDIFGLWKLRVSKI